MSVVKSFKCDICKTHFHQHELEDHAEATGHSKFSESEDPVPRLVCRDCGKPSRSQIEWDLHSKRTGHQHFDDRTHDPIPTAPAPAPAVPSASEPMIVDGDDQDPEVAAAIRASLGDVSEAPAPGPSAAEAHPSGDVEPIVDPAALQNLMDMGFGRNRCVRALFSTGSTSVEQCVQWIMDHEGDSDLDKPLLVPKEQAEPPKKMSPEEAKARAEELMKKAREKRALEDKEKAAEAERERIRRNKELLEAKRKEEDQERMRNIMFRQREKEELERAKEEMRRKLEYDRKERRKALGLPEELTEEEKAREDEKRKAEAERNAARFGGSIRPVEKLEKIRGILQDVVKAKGDQKAREAMQMLLTLLGNVARCPEEDKFRRIRLSNEKIKAALVDSGAVPVLEIIGFAAEGEFMVLGKESVDMNLLNNVGGELNSAMSNPFFGKL